MPDRAGLCQAFDVVGIAADRGPFNNRAVSAPSPCSVGVGVQSLSPSLAFLQTVATVDIHQLASDVASPESL